MKGVCESCEECYSELRRLHGVVDRLTSERDNARNMAAALMESDGGLGIAHDLESDIAPAYEGDS